MVDQRGVLVSVLVAPHEFSNVWYVVFLGCKCI